MKISRETAKLAGRLAMLVTISRVRGQNSESGVTNYFVALEHAAMDAATRDPSIRPMAEDLIKQIRESMQPKSRVITQ